MGHMFEITAGDRLPSLEGGAIDRDTGRPLDLTNATAVVAVRASGASGAVVATGVATIVGPTQLNPSGINLRYDWATGQTATAGYYQGVFRLTYADTRTRTVPVDEPIPIVVFPRIA
jgi:hypothetical protein